MKAAHRMRNQKELNTILVGLGGSGTPSGCRTMGEGTGDVARGLAQPPANGWQPFRLREATRGGRLNNRTGKNGVNLEASSMVPFILGRQNTNY